MVSAPADLVTAVVTGGNDEDISLNASPGVMFEMKLDGEDRWFGRGVKEDIFV